MKKHLACINDKFLPADEAALSVHDLAIQRGYAVFDFFQTINGRPIFLQDHLDRLWRSMAELRLDIGKTQDQLRSLLLNLLEQNAIPDSGIRITVTGGVSEEGYSIAPSNLIITHKPLKRTLKPLERAFRLMTWPHLRQFPSAKTIDYVMAIWLRPKLKERAVDDVLYIRDGIVSECPRSNFFIVTRDGCLATPGVNVLQGITRKQLLELAKSECKVEPRDVKMEDIRTAAEAFITSTSNGITPVVRVDEHAIGDGQTGPITRRLSALLTDRVISAAK